MTTVAYRNGVMACDSCWSHQSAVDTLQKKVIRLKSGALLGQAGDNDAREIINILNKIGNEKLLPLRTELHRIRCEFFGLLVMSSGKMFKIATTHQAPETWTDEFEDDLGIWPVRGKFAAIGSGSDFAIGAMAHGASAKQAVRIACRYDLYSRPPVVTFCLV